MGKNPYDVDTSMHKCQHCGLYFVGWAIDSHERACHSNPENRADED